MRKGTLVMITWPLRASAKTMEKHGRLWLVTRMSKAVAHAFFAKSLTTGEERVWLLKEVEVADA